MSVDRPYIIDDTAQRIFRLNRETLVSDEIHRLEIERIFARCWIYVGHGSEVARPGDFKTRTVAGRPIILCRTDSGEIRCLLNTCRHRGAVVCREREGHAKRFNCLYHGWAYDNAGRLLHVPGANAYPDSFEKDAFNLRSPARFEAYRDFWFMCLDAQASSLADYLGNAKEYIDLVVDQSPNGRMEIIAGTQEYDVAANWKLLVENSVDDYHLPSTHATWLTFMANSGVEVRPKLNQGLVLPAKGLAIDLGNGHFATDNVNYRGRPVASWIPLYGKEAQGEIAEIRAELVTRLGADRAARVAETNRNLVIFPNLVINDGSSVTVRTFYPVGPQRMHVTAWALGPIEEDENARARRLDSFLTFYGPGGFATPDDIEALEMVQQGLSNWRDDPWSEMSRGMDKDLGEQLNSDEHHLRTFWRRWNSLMEDAR
jgi:p-cumate 2,3-dioxygenase subunit alpha